MDDLKKRRLDRALGEINHMMGRAPTATEEVRSAERRRFLELSGTFGFTAAEEVIEGNSEPIIKFGKSKQSA